MVDLGAYVIYWVGGLFVFLGVVLYGIAQLFRRF